MVIENQTYKIIYMKNRFLLLLILFVSLATSNCGKLCDKNTTDGLVDLATTSIGIFAKDSSGLATNVDILAKGIIGNLQNLFCDGKKSADAGATVTQYTAQYRSSPDNAWQTINLVTATNNDAILEVNTPSIASGYSDTLETTMRFSNSGQYRLSQKADGLNELTERNEDNNKLTSDDNDLRLSKDAIGYYEFEIVGNNPAKKGKLPVIYCSETKIY